jgi:hypothetical protein
MPLRTDVLDCDERAADPAAPSDGEFWYNQVAGTHRGRQGGVTVDIPGAGGGALPSLPGITKTIFVDKGSNVPVDGSIQQPYHDLATAIAAAVLLAPSVANRIAIITYTGDYSEPALAVPSWVTIIGVSEAGVIIRATVPGSPLFDLAPFSGVCSLSIEGPAGNAGVQINVPGAARAEDIRFLSGLTGAHATGANARLFLDEVDFDALVGVGILSDNGGRIDGGTVVTEAGSAGVQALTSSQVWLSNLRCRQSTLGVVADSGADVHMNSVSIDGAGVAVRTGAAGGNIYGSNVDIRNSVTYDVEQQLAGSKIELTDCRIPDASISWVNAEDLAITAATNIEGEPVGFNVQHTAVGSPSLGRKTALGEGIPYVEGMSVITTDATAGPVSDGGNLTDVSAAASSPTGSTFTFQGLLANHTILIGTKTPNADVSDVLKHWGLRILQTTAAVEVTPKSFVFERWDGAAWTAYNVMAMSDPELYRYANEVFIRSNSREFIRYGMQPTTSWPKKIISGQDLYWTRIRIAVAVTTLPVFEQFRLIPNITLFEEDGSVALFGSARYRRTLLSAGNVFGETGGIGPSNVPIGAGGVPTGWIHNLINSLFNNDGDAIYYQFELPRGIDTSQPFDFDLALLPESGVGPSLTSWTMSILPVEVQGVLEADPAGGKVPVARTLANTETVTAKAAQTVSLNSNMILDGKQRLLSFNGYDISDYYSGDSIFLRLEMDADGPNNVNVTLIYLAIEGTQWAHGERL